MKKRGQTILFLVMGIVLILAAPTLAADLNGYTAQYEVPLSIPVPTGSISCVGASSANPNANAEYIIRGTAGWDEINNPSYDKFFVCPGNYIKYIHPNYITRPKYEGIIILDQSGTPNNPRYIVWWTDKNYDTVTTPVRMQDNTAGSGFTPGSLGPEDQAKIGRIWVKGADHIIIDR